MARTLAELPRAILFAEAVECGAGADVEARIADSGGAETGVLEVVLRQDLPIGVRPEHSQLAAFTQDVDLAVAGHGRGPVAIQRSSQAVYLERFAGSRIEAGHDAAISYQVQHALIKQGRGHVGQRFAIAPQYPFTGHIPASAGADRHEGILRGLARAI